MAVATDEAITKALQGLLKRKGVLGYVILDKAGVPIQSSFEPGHAQTYAGLVPPLVYLADDMVRDTDPQVHQLCILGSSIPHICRSISTLCPVTVRHGKTIPFAEHTTHERAHTAPSTQDELQFLRVRSAKQEIMVSAHPDFTLAVVQSTGTQPVGK